METNFSTVPWDNERAAACVRTAKAHPRKTRQRNGLRFGIVGRNQACWLAKEFMPRNVLILTSPKSFRRRSMHASHALSSCSDLPRRRRGRDRRAGNVPTSKGKTQLQPTSGTVKNGKECGLWEK